MVGHRRFQILELLQQLCRDRAHLLNVTLGHGTHPFVVRDVALLPENLKFLDRGGIGSQD